MSPDQMMSGPNPIQPGPRMTSAIPTMQQRIKALGVATPIALSSPVRRYVCLNATFILNYYIFIFSPDVFSSTLSILRFDLRNDVFFSCSTITTKIDPLTFLLIDKLCFFPFAFFFSRIIIVLTSPSRNVPY